jgi:hypothetical protein
MSDGNDSEKDVVRDDLAAAYGAGSVDSKKVGWIDSFRIDLATKATSIWKRYGTVRPVLMVGKWYDEGSRYAMCMAVRQSLAPNASGHVVLAKEDHFSIQSVAVSMKSEMFVVIGMIDSEVISLDRAWAGPQVWAGPRGDLDGAGGKTTGVQPSVFVCVAAQWGTWLYVSTSPKIDPMMVGDSGVVVDGKKVASWAFMEKNDRLPPFISMAPVEKIIGKIENVVDSVVGTETDGKGNGNDNGNLSESVETDN